jgi:Acetyl xylan esterase (AXE1)
VLIAAVAALAVAPGAASAAPVSVFTGHTMSGAGIPCVAQTDGVRVCHGTDGGSPASDRRLKTFDGVPLEVYVMLPPAPSSGTDGGYPLIIQSHGWGGSAGGPGDSQYFGPTADAWASAGYAVVQLTARGWGDSCGSAASRLVGGAACIPGYIHLDDTRYEIRDPQYAAGLLADEGLIDPARIGATGESYGGGVSLALATLKDRIMATDGTLAPWRSPGGKALRIAAGSPVIPWSDLVYSLLPNGRTLDYQVASPTTDLSPIGVSKQSFTAGLYALGQVSGYYAPPGFDQQADITSWYGLINAGEPYDSNPLATAITTQIARYRSAYYLLDGAYGTAREAPAPLLIANGFTDDLFPVDEAVRYYNLDRALYPSNPIALFAFDGGHMRGQNKSADRALLSDRIRSFFDHYVKGDGSQPALGATALTETCPAATASGGPFSAPTWDALHPGEVLLNAPGTKTVLSGAGDPSISHTVDPVTGGGACASTPSADQGAGVATYRLPAASGGGYTLLGSPTVIANLGVTGTFPYLAARLWDVNPATNTQTLVARGVYRIDSAQPNGVQVFQLHPGAWHYAAGHIPKLELLGQDSPYARISNGTFSVSVSDLQLRLPVHELPGAAGTSSAVTKPLAHVSPGVQVQSPACRARPVARITKRRTRASRRHGVAVFGTAGEPACAHATSAARRRQRITRVNVSISRTLPHGRCRFLLRSGTLTRTRSCLRPAWLKARGTVRWTLRQRSLPRGSYLVRVEAVDGNRQHSRRSSAAAQRITLR